MNSIEKKPLRALIIEDREDDALLMLNVLKRGGYHIYHERVDTAADLQEELLNDWDIVFSDHDMPTMNGMEALSMVRKNNPDVPFIFVSGTIGEDVAVNAMRTGAQDYIMKDNLKRLLPAVERELRDFKIRQSQRKAEQRLHYMAHYDALTGLPNRFNFIEQVDNFIQNNGENENPIAVVYIDLDRFKTINDSLGYDAGNQLLKKVAERLARCVEYKGVAARLATDEFAILLNRETSKTAIASFVKTVFLTLEIPYTIHGWSLYFSVSMGVALYPDDAGNATDLLGNADIATYRAKAEGGSGYLFYDPAMAVQLEERLSLERHMRLGISKGEFSLHYQPQLELATGKIVGVEALLRWNNAEKGSISPANFIPLAEDTGFILPLGQWVLRQACAQIKAWRDMGFLTISVAVNLSARQFHEANLAKSIMEILEEYQLPPQSLELEITETAIMRDSVKAIQTLKKLRSLGIKVALDDFGTGYSSLSYLKEFKTDHLKIDQSFIKGLPDDKADREIVSAIIAMSDKLSIKTIAEGVETEAQYNFLMEQGCTLVQGYYISRPALPDTFLETFKNQKKHH